MGSEMCIRASTAAGRTTHAVHCENHSTHDAAQTLHWAACQAGVEGVRSASELVIFCRRVAVEGLSSAGTSSRQAQRERGRLPRERSTGSRESLQLLPRGEGVLCLYRSFVFAVRRRHVSE